MEELQINVSRAVYILNHDTESSNRIAANQWLVQFQQTDSVWDVASSILTTPTNPDFELLFFAAQMLKRKIQTEGSIMSLEVKDSVFHSLLTAAKRFSSGCSQLLTQICVALAALMLQTVDHGKLIEHLFNNLRSLQCEVGGNVVALELLTILPEELGGTSDYDAKISLARRRLYTQEVLSHTSAMFEFLISESMKSCPDTLQSHERKSKVLRCLLSWVRAGCFSEIPVSSIQAQQVLNFVFSSLQDLVLFDLSIEILVELVTRHVEFCHVVLCRVPHLQENLLFPAYRDGDDKVLYGLACLMSELGQAAPSLVFESSLENLAFFEAMLRCVAFPSSEWGIADMTLPFWSTLANHISGLETTDLRIIDHKEKIFYPMFSALLDALLERVQVDDFTYNRKTSNIELPDGLLQFRTNIVETYLDICYLLKPAALIHKLSLNNCMHTTAPLPWKEVEARLFTLNVVADMVMSDVQTFDFSSILKLVMGFSSTPFEELKGFMSIVHKTLAEVIGSYSKWILSPHTDARTLLEFLATGIVGSQYSRSYASSLRKFCEESMLLFCEAQYLEFLLWIGEATEKIPLDPESEEDIVCALSTVFGSVKNVDLKNNLFIRFLSSSYSSITKLIDEESVKLIKGNPASYAHILNSAIHGLSRIGTSFRFINSKPASRTTDDIECVFLKTLWPLLHKLFRSEHAKKSSLSSAACRALSLAVRSSGQQLLTLLPDILDCLATSFLECQAYDCYIQTASVVMEEFNAKTEYAPLFVTTFEKFTKAPAFSNLTPYNCDKEPDLMEAYTNFASAFVGLCSKEILATSGPLLEISFHNATLCCPAMHRGVALTAMNYVSCFLEASLDSLMEGDNCFGPVAVQIICRCAEKLVSNLVLALLGVSAISRVHKCAIIFQQISAVCYFCEKTNWKEVLGWRTLQEWLQKSFHSVQCVHEGYLESIKSQWLETLVGASSEFVESKIDEGKAMKMGHLQRKNGRALKRVIRDFAENGRNFVNLR